MFKGKDVIVDEVKGRKNEYLVSDLHGISLGRIFILDLSKENKFCLFRIKMYKKNEKTYNYIKDAIKIMLKSLFGSMRLDKVNILVNEQMDVQPLLDLGFNLEGIMTDSRIKNEQYLSELIFGINSYEYNNNFINRSFSLEGDRIELRIFTPKYAEAITNYCINNRKHLEHFEPLRDEQYYSLDCQRKLLIEEYKNYLNSRSVSFGIFSEDKLIGRIKLSNIVLGTFKSATIGYSIDKDFEGKGYMKEAVNLAVDYAFHDLDLNRVEASAMIDNIRSQRVLKACGFKELGINEKYLFINGSWKDHVTFYKTI